MKKISVMVVGLLALALAVAPLAGAAPPTGSFGPGPSGAPGGPVPPGPPGQPVPPGPPQGRDLYRQERFIVQLYQGFLNRRPSPDEVRTWSARMGGGTSPMELVRLFMSSDEYFILQTYRGLLGREADPPGMANFSRALRGGQSRAFVVETIIGSEEFRNRMR